MALPKKVKKDINIAPQALQPRYPYGYNGITTPIRRKELADYITEDGTFLPKSVLHEDMDGGMLDFVKSQLGVTISGKKINIIDRILTLQRWGEFANTWTFANEDRNVELPFIVVVRKPDVQYGSNPSLQYTIPQPVPVDITYDVKIISNRMRELNTFNRKVMQKFTSRQAYTFVKGHYIPIVMTSLSDESVIDTENRRYYQQNYQFQLQGFLIDEEEFEVKPAVTRSLLFYDVDTSAKRSGLGSSTIQDGLHINDFNPDKYRRKIDFDASTTTFNITYAYNASVTLIRTDNVSGITYKINGTTVSNVVVNLGDNLTITITKSTAGAAYVVIEEKIHNP